MRSDCNDRSIRSRMSSLRLALRRRPGPLAAVSAAGPVALVWAVASLALLAGCASGGVSGGSSTGSAALTGEGGRNGPPVKVALLLPLSAPGARPVAKALKQAGELALFDFDNPSVKLSVKDTRGVPDGARAAVQEAIRDGAELIIGPLFAGEVAAAAPEARRANIPVLAFSSDRKVAGGGVYLMSVLAGSEVERIVTYAASKGRRRMAALAPDTEYGRIVEQSFREAAQRQGVQVVALQKYPSDAGGMTAAAREIAALAPANAPPQIDALFVPAQQDALPALSAQLVGAGFDAQSVKILGASGWDYAGVAKETLLQGGWFAAPDPKGWRDFSKRYADTYGETPPRLASLSYDAVSLAVSLSGNPADQRFSPAELTRSSGFQGVDGLFRLRPDGVSERRFAILEVQRAGSEVADPAPSTFGAAQF